MPGVPGRRLLEGVRVAQNARVAKPAAADHQSHGEAVAGEAARHRDGWLAGEIEDAGVLAPFLVVFGGLRGDGRRRDGRGRHGQDVNSLQDLFHAPGEFRAEALRPLIVRR